MGVCCIDLHGPDRLQVLEYLDGDLRADMEDEGADDPTDLSDWDRRVFKNERAANAFLKRYCRVLKSLKSKGWCYSRQLPSMPYRKRMLVLSIMGLKSYTCRDYRKDWQPGQLFNLHDRTHFVTVKLIKITKVGPREWRYDFKIGAK